MSIDTAVNLFMESIENPVLVSLSKIIDFIFEPLVLIAIGLIIAGYLYSERKKNEAYVFTVSMILMGAIGQLLKDAVMRVRPLNSLIIEETFSFPSGHALASILLFGLIVYIFFEKKSLKIKILSYSVVGFLVLLTGLSRIYLRVHWFTDVLGGWVIGGIILIGGILILKKLDK